MYHLRLLGGASIDGDDGPLEGSPVQRHRLALLAVLASAHPRGVSRVRVMELLWPGRPAGPARNLLNQAVHQLRKALGARTIRTVGEELRLDPGRLSCDLISFREALESGELARAASLYRGPFLDGLALPDAIGFERWVAGERLRLRDRLSDALETLADEESSAGEHRAAAVLWRRRVALDPYDGSGVVGLMRALAGAGDRAGAIREAEAHAARLEEELGVEPDPAVAALRARLGDGIRARTEVRAAPDPDGGHGHGLAAGLPIREPVGGRMEPRLVGRHTEWERLQEAWRAVARGEAGMALVAGEAGIGKSRLAHELVAWAEKRGVVTARARSWAAEGRLAYGPVAEWLRSAALRASLEAIDAPWRADLAPLVPDLARPADAHAPHEPITSPANGRRQRFFRALAGAVLGRGEPRMLLIDDLQWCDPDTLQWLHFLLRFEPSAPLMVLGTARMDEVVADHPVRLLLADLRRDDRFSLAEIALEPLSPEETAALGGAVAGRELDEAESARLYRESEGHPLFVVEGVRAGMLAESGGADAGEPASLPVRVGTVIRARLGQLSPPAREVARVAATVGREFSPEVVVAASELAREAVADALDELTERGIVRPSGGALDFTHDKLREVVYADLNTVRRSLLHERVAGAIRARAGVEVDAVAGALAGHWERAGDLSRALALYRRAARRAREVHGHEEAAGYLERALGLLDGLTTVDAEERARLELALQQERADSLLRTRGWAAPEVAAAHERELELAEAAGDGEARCRALWGLQSVRMVRAEVEEARLLGGRLLGLAREEADPLHMAAGHFVIGFASFLMGAFAAAAEHADRGIERFGRLPAPDADLPLCADVGVLLLSTASHAAWYLGREERALLREEEARATADEFGAPFARTAALVYAALLNQYRRERELAEERAAGAIALAEEFGFPHYLATARFVRGWALSERGEPGSGLAEIAAASESYTAIGSQLRKPYFLGLESRAHARLGRPGRALERVEEALALGEATGERWYEAELRMQRAELEGTVGDPPTRPPPRT